MNTKMRALTLGTLLLAALAAGCTANAATTVARIYDGDTVTLISGERVRLLQIDSPELSSSECYANEAKTALVKILSGPGSLSMRIDPALDKVDKYGRLLRYIFKGNVNVNLKMVEVGAAAPYFYQTKRGQYSDKLLAAANTAKKNSIGLWKLCSGTNLQPNSALDTFAISSTILPTDTSSSCDPNYGGCIPISAADLDCADIKRLGLAPVRVIGSDIYRLDRDGDGVGCDK